MASNPDVLVIGGGPAGLATAIAARQHGLAVRLLEAAQPPIDKACGEGLMPDGAQVLEGLGVEIPPDRRFELRGIRYLDGDLSAEGSFPGRPGWGVRRVDLHAALARRAESLGVDLRWGEAAQGLGSGGVRTRHGVERARWLVAADGLASPLRAAAGLDGPRARRARFGVRRHYAVAPWADRVEVHWSEGLEVYVTPVSAETTGVAILFEGPRPDFGKALHRFPSLARSLEGAAFASLERGAGPFGQSARAVVRGNLALVGDAAGYLDAITGEGLAVALHEAIALADAIAQEDLARYAAAHRRIVRLPDVVTRLLLAAERRPLLRRRLVCALAADPRLFDRLLALHVRASRPVVGALGAALRLSWGLLARRHGLSRGRRG